MMPLLHMGEALLNARLYPAGARDLSDCWGWGLRKGDRVAILAFAESRVIRTHRSERHGA
jgi:hypothetical protein